MAALFVSHSSKDDAAANALEAWLVKNGFTDIFVDHHSIAGGDKWREELRASAAACRVVICLVTENWLASDECFGEFVAAVYLGRRIIPLLLLPRTSNLSEATAKRLAKVCAEDQGITLGSCVTADGCLDIDADDGAANRLKAGLRAAGALSRVGLDPEAFSIDRKIRPTPFPGLASFGDDDADAALFYGRSREIALALEELRKMRAEGDLRPFVILGASGAGKSSLLKAGILPRLRRERPAWLPLRAFHPGSDPLLNFADAFARSLAQFGKIEAHGLIRDRLLDSWLKAERGANSELSAAGLETLASALEAEGQKLRTVADSQKATILISVDQAEEITRASGQSADAMSDYLRVALAASTTDWLLAFTVRSDSFPELQSHRRFQGLEARPFDLRAMSTFRFDSVVEEPARRYGLEIEPALVEALLKDIPNEDALPLLAFTLQRLWRQFAGSGVLTKLNYDKLGGLKGLIEDAAERALRGLEPEQDLPLPSGEPAQRTVDLGASTFVPKLAQVNEQGAIIRRVAKWGAFNDEQKELIRRFDRWRLIVQKGDGDSHTVEVVHEALFREWTRLKRWLEPERARLDSLRLLQIDASTWDRKGRDSAFLSHRSTRLVEANKLSKVDDYRKYLDNKDFDYLIACEKREAAERTKMLWRRRRAQALLITLITAIAISVAWWQRPWLKEQLYWGIYAHPLTVEQERLLRPKAEFIECADCPTMVVIPVGSITMGSQDSADEQPPHTVTINRPFAIAMFELTFAQWDACVSHGDCNPRINDQRWGRGQQPVINVSWKDVQQYVAWLKRMTGKEYRLLTESEWEYAARAARSTHFSFGHADAELDQYAWYADNAGRQPHPVGQKKPNAFGLYDMHGNVSEWVEDCYRDNYRDAASDGSAWTTVNCNSRVIRGGSWFHRSRMLRSAARDRSNPERGNESVGMRVGRSIAP